MKLLYKTTFQKLVAEHLIRAVGLMVGHLNSAQRYGIILMMPGLPVGGSGMIVGHCITGKIIITSKLTMG